MAEFDGKIVLITGGGAGIGRATALAFAQEGAKVVIGNRNRERGEETVSLIRDNGGEASFLQTDVSSEEDVRALAEHTVSTYGRLDVAFNNAGVEGVMAPVADQTVENYHYIMDINVKGVWLSMKYQIRQMLKTGGGAIVNNSSVAGLIGARGIGIYCASKHAVMGLTKSAALEYSAQGIRINTVNPAVIDTSMADRLADGFGATTDDMHAMHPIGRMGEADEVANAVLWMCSDKASFVTGTGLCVDGGYTAQ